MKRLMGILIAVLLVAFAATPAMAQGTRGDRLCTGGSEVIRAEETVNSVVLFGCGARIQKGAQVSRDVVSFGGDVVMEESARVRNDAVVFGGDLDVSGTIDGDVTVFGGRLTLQPTAVVNGDVLAFGGSLDRKDGAVVRGQIKRNTGSVPPIPPVPSIRNGWNFLGDMVWGFVQSFFMAVGLGVLGALILVFMPKQLGQVREVAETSALPSIGVGCLTLLVVPPLMILFIITCLGIPISAILGIALVAAAAFGWIAIAILLGERLLNALKVKNSVPLLAMVAGLLALWLVSAVPVLGWLIGLFLGALAVGAVVLTRFGTRPYPYMPPPTAPDSYPILAEAKTSAVVPSEPAPPTPDNPSGAI